MIKYHLKNTPKVQAKHIVASKKMGYGMLPEWDPRNYIQFKYIVPLPTMKLHSGVSPNLKFNCKVKRGRVSYRLG